MSRIIPQVTSTAAAIATGVVLAFNVATASKSDAQTPSQLPESPRMEKTLQGHVFVCAQNKLTTLQVHVDLYIDRNVTDKFGTTIEESGSITGRKLAPYFPAIQASVYSAWVTAAQNHPFDINDLNKESTDQVKEAQRVIDESARIASKHSGVPIEIKTRVDGTNLAGGIPCDQSKLRVFELL
ncbi:MAG: hypothetical protein MRY79_07035 [Alphaproteobacteria bacterium]|nr:hypothetical protein [Alphaproteobacteria bacterium]